MIAQDLLHSNKPLPPNFEGSYLDLFSISQTSELASVTYAPDFHLLKCANNAPFFAYQEFNKAYIIAQGNCHSWACPRCGLGRAKQEYGRIVEGCRTLAKDHDLYFITLTCRGRALSLKDSEAGYLQWTNRLLTTLRKSSKKHGVHWCYVQVTERQKRGHPHSHLLTTYHPHDLRLGTNSSWKRVQGNRTEVHTEALRSDYLLQRCTSAGLGDQYDISTVRSAEAASRYVAKYMFKESMFLTDWPKKWRRVRYSHSFPKLPEQKSDAMVLITKQDWRDLARKAVVVRPKDIASHEEAMYQLKGSDMIVWRHKDATV